MIRTQIQLPEAEYEELRRLAAREHRSMADCIREGIRWVLGRARSGELDLAAVSGKFRPMPMEDLKPHDRWFAESAIPIRVAASPRAPAVQAKAPSRARRGGRVVRTKQAREG